MAIDRGKTTTKPHVFVVSTSQDLTLPPDKQVH